MKYRIETQPRTYALFNDFERVLSGFFDDMPSETAMPRVDIRKSENEYILEAELPGYTEKDVEVKVDENLLTISGSVKPETEKKNGYIIRERKAAPFQRSFVLPNDVDREKIRGSQKNGILTLTLQKKEEAKPKSIEVKTE